MVAYVVSIGAGALTALSPCILPVLPIMAGSSMSERRSGPLLIALGLIVSLVTMGLFFSSVTTLMGLEEEQIRVASAWLLVFFGIFISVPSLRDWLNSKFEGIGNKALQKSSRLNINSRFGQFGIGFMLGAAWSPCVGPTLGVALGLAGSKEGFFQAALMMSLFGIGLSIPLLTIAYGLRNYIQSKLASLMKWNQIGMKVLGSSIALVGIGMISGFDKVFESYMSSILPTWFLQLSSSL